ncbi:hypothetical protein AB0K09_03415 [Streptomyces sp. NPDC049577]|uniref:hypothetical protein n=1 Tax=Streptomyces sp. NPDC049577 TaxID=3155153 RepID=UPI0034354C6A
MPLSVPLLLVPGEPDRHYTVHVHRVRGRAGSRTVPPTADYLAALEANARLGLTFVSECIAAELADSDVEVIERPDGSAEAVARVLCDSDACAAVAKQYRRDADEDVEAEAARAWAATKLQDQTIELLQMREEVERPTPGKTPADILAAVLAAQQERTGGLPDRVVLMLDEAAHLFRENGLFHDRSPEGVRREINRLVRKNRAMPEPQRSADTWAMPPTDAIADLIAIPDWAVKAHLDLPNAFYMKPEHLVHETETLARSVAADQTRGLGVKRLAELCREVARRCDAEPQPPCPAGCEPDDDPGHALMDRIGYRPRALPAGEVRAALGGAGRDWSLRTLPDTLPQDDAALVLVYREPTPGLALLEHLRTGNDAAVPGDITVLLRWLTADGK